MKGLVALLFGAVSLLIPLRAAASVNVVVNGTSYTIPQTNEKGWGTNVTSWIQAISSNSLYPNSGTFTLGAELDFGPNFGLKTLYVKSRSANVSSTGIFRLANTDSLAWRNSTNSGDLGLTPNATDGVLNYNGVALDGVSLTQTLTNKTLTTPIISTISNTGTLTLPTSTDTLIGRATTDTLTNKSIDATTNTLSNISNTSIATAAAIARTKVASGTANHVIINDGAGVLSSEANLAVTRGGTGLGTLTANNVILGNGTSTPGFVAPSTNGNLLTSNGTTWVSSASVPNVPVSSYEVYNTGISTGVAANALTVTLTQADGSSAPAVGGAAVISFRNATATSGGYTTASITSTRTLTVASGATLGSIGTVLSHLYIYVLNSSGTFELMINNGNPYLDGTLVTTVALSGASNTFGTSYSTTQRTSVPVRLIGEVQATEATAGTWATTPSLNNVIPVNPNFIKVNAGTSGFFPNYVISDAAGAATASTSYIDMGQNLTITTSGGPVELRAVTNENEGVMNLNPSTTLRGCYAKIIRDSTTDVAWYGFAIGGSVQQISDPFSMHQVDFVAAGTYNYKIQFRTSGGTCSSSAVRLIAREIR